MVELLEDRYGGPALSSSHYRHVRLRKRQLLHCDEDFGPPGFDVVTQMVFDEFRKIFDANYCPGTKNNRHHFTRGSESFRECTRCGCEQTKEHDSFLWSYSWEHATLVLNNVIEACSTYGHLNAKRRRRVCIVYRGLCRLGLEKKSKFTDLTEGEQKWVRQVGKAMYVVELHQRVVKECIQLMSKNYLQPQQGKRYLLVLRVLEEQLQFLMLPSKIC